MNDKTTRLGEQALDARTNAAKDKTTADLRVARTEYVTTRDLIARAVCRVAIYNEGDDGDAAYIERRVERRWEGYVEDAIAVLDALRDAGYRIVKEHQ